MSLSDRDVEILRAMKKKLDHISGPGVTNGPDFVTIGGTAPNKRTVLGDDAPVIDLFKDSIPVSSQSGRFTSKSLTTESTEDEPTTHLVEADFGTFASAADAYLWDLSFLPNFHAGVKIGTHADGKPIYLRLTGPRLIFVKIISNATGGGKYNGRSFTHDRTSNVPATGNLAESEFGTVASANDCLVLNASEEGQSTHDLTSGTVKQDSFLGLHVYTNSDGIKVVVINGFDWEECT